jgi:hypothetical protein
MSEARFDQFGAFCLWRRAFCLWRRKINAQNEHLVVALLLEVGEATVVRLRTQLIRP